MLHPVLHIFMVVFGFFSVLSAPVFAADTSDRSSTETLSLATYTDAKARVDAGDYESALPMLLTLTATDPTYTDAWTLLGFTRRMLGNLG